MMLIFLFSCIRVVLLAVNLYLIKRTAKELEHSFKENLRLDTNILSKFFENYEIRVYEYCDTFLPKWYSVSLGAVYSNFLQVPKLGTWEFLHQVILVGSHFGNLPTLHIKIFYWKEVFIFNIRDSPIFSPHT